MIPYNLETIDDTDYILELTETTKDSFILQHLFNFAMNKERHIIKRKTGVTMPNVEYKKLKSWNMEQLDSKSVGFVRVMFNNPTIAHYKNVLADIKQQTAKDGFKFLNLRFDNMSFKKTKKGWVIKTTFTGQYIFEK